MLSKKSHLNFMTPKITSLSVLFSFIMDNTVCENTNRITHTHMRAHTHICPICSALCSTHHCIPSWESHKSGIRVEDVETYCTSRQRSHNLCSTHRWSSKQRLPAGWGLSWRRWSTVPENWGSQVLAVAPPQPQWNDPGTRTFSSHTCPRQALHLMSLWLLSEPKLITSDSE